MGYTASITANCWKVHTCVNCSTIFRYLMTRKVTAQGNTEDQARTNLGNAMVSSLTKGVDQHSCPSCGMHPPEMVAAARNGRFSWLNGLVVVVGITLMILLGIEYPVSTVCFWGGVLLAPLAAGFALTSLKNPNTNVQSNLTRAQQSVQGGKLFIEQAPENPPVRRSDMAELTHGRHPLAMLLLCVGLFLMALPEAVRLVNGWQENDKFFPAVVGPGDNPTFYFDRKIHSIKGYWRATSIGAEMDGQKLTATAKDNNWGNSISVKSSEENDQETIWLKIQMPAGSEFSKKDAKLDLKVQYLAPVMSGSSNFKEEEGEAAETPQLHMATPGAGKLYGKLAWLGVLGGSGLILVAGFMFMGQAKSLKGNEHHALQAED